jgi:aminopeptidase-like protein
MDREPVQLGQEMHRLVAELYPIPRSITGDGVRQTLAKLRERIPLEIHEVPSGTRAFDWTVPDEWNVREAYVANVAGERLIDFRKHNLHLVGYSTPIRAKMSLAELRPHLHALPDRPDWIPYRTSYYKPSWGFCLSQRQLEALPEGDYEVVIDATLAPGSLTYGELLLPGRSTDEILLSAHICHPSLANDNLSGIAVLTFLAAELAKRSLKHSVRFVFAPGTIGAITWLARNERTARRIRHGLVVAGVGDSGDFTYKRSRRGDAVIDRAVAYVLSSSGRVIDFVPYGYDERQYCSPGFNLPVGLFMRTLHGTSPRYHTSGDDLSFVHADKLEESLRTILSVVDVLERNGTFVNTNPKCEPQLGRRGLYEGLAGRASPREVEMAMLWVLNLSDGGYDLLRIAERSGLAFGVIADATEALLKAGLLRETGVRACKT